MPNFFIVTPVLLTEQQQNFPEKVSQLLRKPERRTDGIQAVARSCAHSLNLEGCQLEQAEKYRNMPAAGLNQARLFLFTCNLHKNGCILPYFRMKIDRSLPAIVKQIISPRAKLIHKMFQMGTITYSFTLIALHFIHIHMHKIRKV